MVITIRTSLLAVAAFGTVLFGAPFVTSLLNPRYVEDMANAYSQFLNYSERKFATRQRVLTSCISAGVLQGIESNAGLAMKRAKHFARDIAKLSRFRL